MPLKIALRPMKLSNLVQDLYHNHFYGINDPVMPLYAVFAPSETVKSETATVSVNIFNSYWAQGLEPHTTYVPTFAGK